MSLFERLLGIALMLPSLFQVPLPQIDFHVIRHLHGTGEVCPKHDHLLRWHPQAGEGEDVAVLHWHWLLPRSADVNFDAAGRSIPSLHAHDGDEDGTAPSSPNVLIREATSTESRVLDGSPGFSQALTSWIALIPPAPPDPGLSCRGISARPSPDATRSRLVRWNC